MLKQFRADTRSAIQDIQAILRNLREMDGVFVEMERTGADCAPDDSSGLSPETDSLYEEAKECWRQIFTIVSDNGLESQRYFDISDFKSRYIEDALSSAS